MAKIRIYELARDLNMTNKALIEKLREMDISVKSHMSSLDDSIISQIKKRLFGLKEDNIVETRVKSTVIRRRRKPAPKKSIQIEAAAEPEVQVDQAEVAEQPAPKKIEVKELPAEEVIPKPAEVEDQAIKKTDVPVPEEEKKPKKPAVPKPAKPPVAKKVTPKKIKKEKPAKIIKLPVKPPPEEEVPEIEKEAVKPPKPKVTKMPLAEDAVVEDKVSEAKAPVKERKKKKRVKRIEEPVRDKKFFKKKISFRRKEVVEGADLYVKVPRGRKGRKVAKAKTAAVHQKPQITMPKAIFSIKDRYFFSLSAKMRSASLRSVISLRIT